MEKEFAKEREIFNFGKNYKELWSESDSIVRKSYLGLNFRWYGMIKLSNIFTEIVTFLIIFIVIFSFNGKYLSIGFVIAFISSISRFVNSISWNVPYYIKDISEGMNYFDELNDFLCLDEETKGDIKLKSVEKIDFKSVKFRYSDERDFILKGVSFTFEKNKHYGLVGINGVGKSTIVNLLSGVYDNFEGEILIDDKNISDIDIRSLRENILVLKQDFKKFDLSFRDNIILGLDYNEENLIISLILDYFVKTYKPKTVSDFGSGTGEWIKFFIENNVKNIFAFDCSDKMLKICRSKYLTSRVVTQRIDFTKSSLILKSDLILCAFFFNAISFKYFFNIIENIYNSLNSNGLFIFVDNVPTKNENFQELVIAEKWGNKVIDCKYNLYKFDFLIKVFSKYRFEILFKYLLGEDLQIIVCKKI